MSSFTFYATIPQASDNPSDSQSKLLQNFTSIGDTTSSWVTQDHYGFGTGTDGQHLRIRIPAVAASLTPTGAASEIRTAVGSADAAQAQGLFTSSAGSFPMSAVRAFGTCPGNGATGAVSLSNGYNISSISRDDTTKVTTVNLTSGVVTGTSYAVIASITQASTGTSTDQVVVTYTVSSSTVFTLKTINVANNAAVSVTSISFMVLQF